MYPRFKSASVITIFAEIKLVSYAVCMLDLSFLYSYATAEMSLNSINFSDNVASYSANV